MTCDSCFHSSVCGKIDLQKCDKCKDFVDKETIALLPFIAMVERSIKDGKFDKRKTSNNGKMCVVYVDKKKWNKPLIDITSQYYNTDEAEEEMRCKKNNA